ncbi:SIMPL domain-containing protein [Aliiroseovarius crassostreae]|uniref:SIMPL domain-containing protein n=1 Tax=Aliiroseovarius crassostreae TaxID=154981 RepID=UPI003C7B4B1A
MKTLLGILGVVICMGQAALAEGRDTPTLRVTGTGVVSAQPDMAVIRLGVREEAKEAAVATRAVAEALGGILAKLSAAGLDEKDIQTTHLSLAPQLDYAKSGARKQLGYEASSTLTVAIRDLAGLGPMLDQVMQAGANHFNGLQFDLSNREALLDEARKAAVADAMRKAKVLADAAGLTLGPVRVLSEDGPMRGPEPMLGRMAMEAQSSMPVATGEVNVSAQVVMEFSLSE